MKIIRINNEDISQIRPMWEKLNKHHGQNSTHFKEHFRSFTFAARQKLFENKESFAIFIAKDDTGLVG